MPGKRVVDLREIGGENCGPGVVWTLEEGDELNANLVRFPAGEGVGEHVNNEVDVLVLGVSGTGTVRVEEDEYALTNGTLVFVPRGATRSTRGDSDDFAYLTVHRRRGPVRLGDRPGSSRSGEER
jgi:quercetin dioxygenase-like cupin family protein